jgi:hypothetical protein
MQLVITFIAHFSEYFHVALLIVGYITADVAIIVVLLLFRIC